MSQHESFTADNIRIEVSGEQTEDRLVLKFLIHSNSDCLLHWGLGRRRNPKWQAPPETVWPVGTQAFDRHAVQSPCNEIEGVQRLQITLDLEASYDVLFFVLYFPEEKRWLKNGHRDFRISLPVTGAPPSPQQALSEVAGDSDWEHYAFELNGDVSLAAAVQEQQNSIKVLLVCDAEPPLSLHWGLAGKYRHQWRLPPSDLRPADTAEFDHKAVRTPFAQRKGLSWLELDFPRFSETQSPQGLNFVLYQPESDHWLKDHGQNLYVPLLRPEIEQAVFSSVRAQEVATQIIEAEMGRNSWTLMHRFNLCHDLLGKAGQESDILVLLFVWLRFSAIRQLDWQRNYNTKPRELSHAQERLTLRIAELYSRYHGSRTWLRLMLSTLGRGGEGQRVRDEILNIMHRHRIKEVHGHFLEEWHQKLHNNTTPDDTVICEAYLAFLEHQGDLERFYDTLAKGGVSRERLQSFERPIRTDPEYYPDKRDGLHHDFENFLRILRSVHSGTDLDTAAGAARGFLDEDIDSKLNTFYFQRQQGENLGGLVETITELREGLGRKVRQGGNAQAIRELLYLDLALEQTLRGAIEQQQENKDIRSLTHLVWLMLRNLWLQEESDEFRICIRQLRAAQEEFETSPEWALHAKSVTDRAARLVARWSEVLYAQLQPKAEYLGEAFAVDEWTLPLFSEEVIRGGSGFMLSLLLRRLEPLLRQQAGLGGWQVISPARVSGQVRLVESLRSVQGDRFSNPTVLITDRVAGDEEIPPGVTSVITSDTPDIVSHVAVRARNSRVLFATCFDELRYGRFKELNGRQLSLDVSPSGDVDFREDEVLATMADAERNAPVVRRRTFSRWAVGEELFDSEILGGKSNNLQSLRGRLSDWIGLPTSIGIPFGACEAALATQDNQNLLAQITALLQLAKEKPQEHLPTIRKKMQDLIAPKALHEAVSETWHAAGLPRTDWAITWQGIKKVWATKWNERAWFSRTARGMDHDDLMMAVLIQQVVEAKYAFVIHTVNPITGDDDEIYAEVVLGLGETLVGNFPGRALSFSCRKTDLKPTLLSYPNKSVGLYGGGVIFRSDSNGEDLERFAGAGLYDSFLALPPRESLLDYTEDPLVRDPVFRREMLHTIAQIGLEVEQVCGCPQDIEGAMEGGKYYVVQTRPQVGLDE
jgi:alpha-glucan,water dikinase